MRLLLTNDDGINAQGLHALVKELEKEHEVVVSAPDNQRSASGHSITINRPLVVKEVKLEGIKSKAYSVDGTPADCVRVALDKLVEGKVDMVVSGTNRGFNLGIDVLYSGTVSAAIEAAIYNIPAIAMSLDVTDDYENYILAARFATQIVAKAKEFGIKSDVVLNVNVPKLKEEEIKGIKVCRIGDKIFENYFVEKQNEDSVEGYMLMGNFSPVKHQDTDTYYIKQGYVTLTPLHYDLTNFKLLNEVDQWF